MATLTKHFLKKLNAFVNPPDRKTKFEYSVRKYYIYKNLKSYGSAVYCSEEEVKIIIERASKLSISIIGIESRMDDPIPFFDFVIEGFESINPIEDWPLYALQEFLSEFPGFPLSFYIDIPENQIIPISILTGIDY
ncbi:MAG: hypothetical protein IPN61_00575 [Bacteroidetes bacterium]|nr:hypothetical protein [Bacteroidota bacterium]